MIKDKNNMSYKDFLMLQETEKIVLQKICMILQCRN